MATVQEAINQERSKIEFNPRKLSDFLYGKEGYTRLKQILEKNEVVPYNFNIFNKGRVEIIKQAVRDMPHLFKYFRSDMTDQNFIYLMLGSMHQMPGGPHIAMFMKCIEFMGTDQQKKDYLQKCARFEVVGGYAQTEMAHGSDVSSLMTIATYNAQKDGFIIQTPSVDSFKFWPGQIGLFANHALVFAQLIVDGKNHGVQSFIVPIRDQNMKPLPNVKVGDIGPKMGYISRDNGYLVLNKVLVPRKCLLGRFISVQKNGEVKTKGNPKVAYATMMQIRKHLCTSAPKIYASAITIATKYSLFRKQFKNDKKQEIKIMDYQLQQQKIIERVAQYFAITLAGNKINEVSTKNAKLVIQKQDFSLMEQAHLLLSVGKPFFSEIVFDGMEICRKACGGHGFSQYSGFPSLIFEYAPNITQEGENTVLYLQVARHLMKGYKGMLVNNKKVKGSIKYIENYNKLLHQKCNVDGTENWKTQHIQTILAQSVCYLLTVASEKIVTKPQDMGLKEVFNKISGINLRDLAVMHCAYFCFESFKQAVDKQKDPKIKAVTESLCLLFGANFLVTRGIPAIQGGFISKEQIRSLNDLKQILLSKLRPDIIGIVDGFGIPDKYIRSALTYGNPYENYLRLARECDVNLQRMKSADVVKTVKNHLKNPDARL